MTSIEKSFFDVQSDYARFADQWFLTEPRGADGSVIDAREFVEGIPYHGPMPASIPIRKSGREVAFHLAAFDMPVVSTDVAAVISRIAPSDVEFFPVHIQGAKNSNAILNAICRLDCLDESRSEFTRWKVEDGRPDRLGQYHVISTIRVDAVKTGGHHIFRLADWPLALLVSDTLRNALIDIPSLGVEFRPAS